MNRSNTTLDIHEKIIRSDLSGALAELEKIIDSHYKPSLAILKSRINSLELIELEGNQDHESYKIEKNNIIKSLLKLVNKSSSPPTEEKDEIQLVEDLVKIIDTTFITWTSQSKLRDNLVELLEARIPNLSYKTKYDLLANYYDQMDGRELRLHKAIRGYTKNIILPKNIEMIKLLKDHPFIKKTLPKLKYLELHLLLWKSKFDSIFEDDKSVCLIYVGIEEKMKFPPDLLDDLKGYLADKKEG